MSVVTSTTIDGLGTIPVHAEYTHNSVLQDYAEAIALIVNLYKKDQATDPFVDDDGIDMKTALDILDGLASGGRIVDGKQYFITLEMGRSINLLKKSLNTAAYDPNATFPEQIDALKRWQDLSDLGLNSIIEKSINTLKTNKSLQAMIELDYVRAGNEQIFAALSELQEATKATQSALEILNKVQEMHNMLSPAGRNISQDKIDAWQQGNIGNLCTVTTVVSEFRSTFDPMFSQIIQPEIDIDPFTPGNQPVSPETIQDFNKLQTEVRQIIDKLDQINGTYAGGPNEANRAGSLAEQLDNVHNDMQTGLGTWALDNYASAASAEAGNYQRRLTDAITTAQSINDQQRQDLRQQLFVFEEFYRSASSMLKLINDMILKMASNISR